MSTPLMPARRGTRSPTREWKPILAAVDPQDRLVSILQQSKERRNCRRPKPHGRLQDVQRAEIREILCEMLVTSVWEDGDGSVQKEGKNRVEDHNSATRA